MLIIRQWLFRSPFPRILANLSHLLKVIPKALLYTFLRFQWSRQQFEVFWSFISSPSTIMSCMTLAHEELMTVKELDKTLLAEVKHISYWFFGGKDGWVGDNEDAIIKQVMDESLSNRIVRDTTVPHAFTISTFLKLPHRRLSKQTDDHLLSRSCTRGCFGHYRLARPS